MRKSVKKEMILRNNFRLQNKVLFFDNHFNRLNKKRFTATDFILWMKDFKNNHYILWRLSWHVNYEVTLLAVSWIDRDFVQAKSNEAYC